jgi:hypothetical protein
MSKEIKRISFEIEHYNGMPYMGFEISIKDDGTVDQAALWNESPARWAKWNDEQKQDGGADTLAYLNTAIKAQTAKIAAREAMAGSVSNKAAARAQINRLVREVDKCIAMVSNQI